MFRFLVHEASEILAPPPGAKSKPLDLQEAPKDDILKLIHLICFYLGGYF